MSAHPDPPSLTEWLGWPAETVSAWVSEQPDPVVMGWPYNGTRRCYIAYRRRNPGAKDYLRVLIRRQAEIHRLIFAYGVSVILAPSFGAETRDGRRFFDQGDAHEKPGYVHACYTI